MTVSFRGSRAVAAAVLLVFGGGCAFSEGEAPDSGLRSIPATSRAGVEAPTTSAGGSEVDFGWNNTHVVEFDPTTLAAIGPEIPSGYWVERALLTDDLIAITTWTEEEVDGPGGRWRLVVADRSDGYVHTTQRVGDMNVLGVVASPTGEVLVVEPIRSFDGNSSDGFVIHGYMAQTNILREVVRFESGRFDPTSVKALGEGRLGFSGIEYGESGEAGRLRVLVFDLETGSPVVDVILDDFPLRPEDLAYEYVDNLVHAVVWDTVHGRALVIPATENEVISIEYPSGRVQTVTLAPELNLLERLASWWVAPAYAKGLPSTERYGVASGDYLYVAGMATTFTETDSGLQYAIGPTGMMSISLDSLHIVAATEAPIGYLAAGSVGGFLLGGGRIESGVVDPELALTEETLSGLLVVDPETLEVVGSHNVNIWSPWAFRAAADGSVIYVDGGDEGVLVFDPLSGGLHKTGVRTLWEPGLIEQGLRYGG